MNVKWRQFSRTTMQTAKARGVTPYYLPASPKPLSRWGLPFAPKRNKSAVRLAATRCEILSWEKKAKAKIKSNLKGAAGVQNSPRCNVGKPWGSFSWLPRMCLSRRCMWPSDFNTSPYIYAAAQRQEACEVALKCLSVKLFHLLL